MLLSRSSKEIMMCKPRTCQVFVLGHLYFSSCISHFHLLLLGWLPKTSSVSLQPKELLLGVATAEGHCQYLQKGITWIWAGGEDKSPGEEEWKTTKFSAVREYTHLSAIGKGDRSGEIPQELSKKPSGILRPHLMCQSTGNRHCSYGDECMSVTKPTRCKAKSDTAQGLCPI